MRGSAFLVLSLFAVATVAPATAADVPAYITAALADPARPEADRARDAARHAAETIAFAGVKPGDRVLEIFPEGGYYTRILSKVVGSTGNIYAFTPEEILKTFPTGADGSRTVAADPRYSNVSVIVAPALAMTLPKNIDVVWTTQNYHDMHIDKFFPGLDINAFNGALFASLRAGGTYFVSDHEAAPGSGMRDLQLHRFDADLAKTEITHAGFRFDGESDLLRNPADPHTAMVFDAAIRGHTDQFVFRFRKPGR